MPILRVLQVAPPAAADLGDVGDAAQPHHLLDEGGGQDRHHRLARLRIDITDADVFQVGMGGDGDVGREGPGGRRPDHRVPGAGAPGGGDAGDHREVDVDAGRGLVVVLQLRLGQRRPVVEAPVDRLELAEDVAACHEVRQHVEDAGLVPRVERQIRVFPVPQDAQAAELVALDADPLHRLDVAERADLRVLHVGGLRPEVLGDLVLDRQAVAVPPRDVRAVEPAHRQRPDDDVLEHLIQEVPHVDLAVRIRRPIMEDLPLPALAGLADLAVEVLLPPARLDLRLARRQVRLHVEPGDGQVQRVFVGLGVGGHRGRNHILGLGGTPGSFRRPGR